MGVSAGLVPEELIATMAPGGIVFAMSNPDPEIHPEVAKRYAAIVATGRSDFPNQINNVLAFPGVFRGALDAGARRITEKMKVAAAEAIFSVVGDDLAPDHIVPSPLDPRVGPAVAAAVAAASEVRLTPTGDRPARSGDCWRCCWSPAAAPAPGPSMAVGATADPETTLLAQLYAAALRSYGTAAHVETVPDPLAALDSGAVSVVPGFTGRLLQTLRARLGGALGCPGVPRDDRCAARGHRRRRLRHLRRGQAGAGGHRRDRHGVGRAVISPRWCATAPGCRSGAVAGARRLPTAVGTCTLPHGTRIPRRDDDVRRAAHRARSTAAWTTHGRHRTCPTMLVVLADRKPALIRAENVVPLYRRNELDQQQVRAINEIAGVLDTGSLVDMRRQVAEGGDPRTVAESWLSAHPLGR